MMESLCPDVAMQLGAMFECAEHNDGVRIRTPFWYPDGGIVDLFVKERGGHYVVTDYGESLGWLRLQSLSRRRSPKQQRLVQDVCLTLGVELFKGQLIIRCDSRARLADCILRMGQAAVRVSDLWFTLRTRSVESTTDEVEDYLQERTIAFERSVRLAGRSGRSWTIDFQTRTPGRSALVVVLATGSSAAAHRIADHVVAGWHDLQPLRVGPDGPRFVSLFDDTANVWAEEEFRLVESISDVAHWSRPDEFEHLLRDAA